MKHLEMKDLQELGVPQLRVQKWLERGYFSPSIQQASGPGTRNIWSVEDAGDLMAFNRLLECGFTAALALKIIRK